jgi:hypothetical protein
VIVGNIATPEAALFLVENGADGVKVGLDLVQFVQHVSWLVLVSLNFLQFLKLQQH